MFSDKQSWIEIEKDNVMVLKVFIHDRSTHPLRGPLTSGGLGTSPPESYTLMIVILVATVQIYVMSES